MADNLSVALAFAALLHLANENNLSLEQLYGSLDDFVVVHPKIWLQPSAAYTLNNFHHFSTFLLQ